MSYDPECTNIVIYFAHNVVRSTREISLIEVWDGRSGNESVMCTFENKLYGLDNGEVDTIFDKDPTKSCSVDLRYANLLSRVDRMYWFSPPHIGRRPPRSVGPAS